MNFTLITAFSLCSLCWFSVSGSQFQTMAVQSGKEVTLMCPNVTQYDAQIIWFRVVNKTSVTVISTLYPSGNKEQKSDRYETSSHGSTIFLKIKSLDLSDSGLYLCGIVRNGDLLFSGTYLKIDGGDEPDGNKDNNCPKSDGMVKLMSVVLGGLTVVLVMVITGLVVQNVKLNKKLKKAKEEQNPEQSQSRGFDDLNYAAESFRKRAKRRELETNVVYAATR